MTRKTAALMFGIPLLAGAGLILAALFRPKIAGLRPTLNEAESGIQMAESYATVRASLESGRADRDRLTQDITRMEKSRDELQLKLFIPPKGGEEPGTPSGGWGKYFTKQEEETAALQADQLVQTLRLNDGQAEKVRTLMTDEAKKRIKAMEEGDSKALWQRENAQEMRDKLRNILSPSQLDDYDRHLKERDAGIAAYRISLMTDEVASALTLTPNQKKSLKAILKANPALMQDDEGGSPEDRDSGRRHIEAHERRMALLRTSITPTLTPDQLPKLEDYFQDQLAYNRSLAELLDTFMETD